MSTLATIAATDPKLAELCADLVETWAQLPTDQPVSDEMVHAYLRAAYGAGYLRSLSEPDPVTYAIVHNVDEHLHLPT